MADGIIERSGGGHYGMEMEARVAVLETLAAQILATMADMRQEAHEFRLEMRSELRGVRMELHDLRTELHTEVRDFRRVHDRDFRITFGAIITTTVGLAALIAHVAHWL